MSDRPTQSAVSPSLWNIPNALAAFRLIGSIVLVGLTLAGITKPFVWLIMLLLLSDWLDGKLAVMWRQQTTFGARLDSVADATMYAALLFGTLWLKWPFVLEEWGWIAVAVGSYFVTTTAGLIKYGRIPSYHTRGAKISWLLVGVAALFVFADASPWPFRIAMVAVTATNLEATMMTMALPEWHADVLSLREARRLADARLQAVPAKPSDEPVDGQR